MDTKESLIVASQGFSQAPQGVPQGSREIPISRVLNSCLNNKWLSAANPQHFPLFVRIHVSDQNGGFILSAGLPIFTSSRDTPQKTKKNKARVELSFLFLFGKAARGKKRSAKFASLTRAILRCGEYFSARKSRHAHQLRGKSRNGAAILHLGSSSDLWLLLNESPCNWRHRGAHLDNSLSTRRDGECGGCLRLFYD